ncbi:MAG: hypothetical protein KDA47_09160 [Planctomycetales bacterium]|nr:hypothetical protein [Planctomycetales bacterium]
MYVRRREREVQVDSPAKVNLFLEVLGRREDGFHEIETLMAAVAIFDTVRVSERSDDRLTREARWMHGAIASSPARSLEAADAWGDLPLGPENLVLRALAELRHAAGVERGARVQLLKRIPSAAGLGGASGDAAAALVAGNQLWNLGWSRDQLAEVAARLGSDIPFFLGDDEGRLAAAICRGRGERIEPAEVGGRLDLVIVRPPEGLSTAQVYRACRPADRPCSLEPLLAALRRGDPAAVGRGLVNRLEPAAAQLSPWIGRLRAMFDRLGVCGHQMSGSGTSYFGICRHAGQARAVARRLRTSGLYAVATHSLGVSLKR